jgi:hypothetical protein
LVLETPVNGTGLTKGRGKESSRDGENEGKHF